MTDRELRRCANFLRVWSDANRAASRDAASSPVADLMRDEAEEMRVLSLKLYAFARERRKQRRLPL